MPLSIFNDGKHIDEIIKNTTCRRHGRSKGEACFYITTGTFRGERELLALCGARIKRHGFDGQITETTINNKLPAPRNSYKR